MLNSSRLIPDPSLHMVVRQSCCTPFKIPMLAHRYKPQTPVGSSTALSPVGVPPDPVETLTRARRSCQRVLLATSPAVTLRSLRPRGGAAILVKSRKSLRARRSHVLLLRSASPNISPERTRAPRVANSQTWNRGSRASDHAKRCHSVMSCTPCRLRRPGRPRRPDVVRGR